MLLPTSIYIFGDCLYLEETRVKGVSGLGMALRDRAQLDSGKRQFNHAVQLTVPFHEVVAL